jgi:outer membrane protein OmpA-like peptidoglycan-associated protein
MKKIMLFASLLLIFSFSYAQVLPKLKERIKQKVEARTNEKVDKTVDTAFNKAERKVDNTVKGKPGAKNKNDGSVSDSTKKDDAATVTSTSFKTYSKYDFVPGEKVIMYEDFTKDNIGDFPDKWNTNGSGEIVTVNKAVGRYLMTKKLVVMYPEWVKNLPDNFTLEFDLMTTDKFSYYSGWFIVGVTTNTDIGKNFRNFSRFGDGRISNGGGFEIAFHPENAGGLQGLTFAYSSNNEKEVLKNEADQNQLMVPQKTFCHISIWRQKNRVRVYMNDKKVWDLPKLVADGLNLNSVYFRNDGATNEEDSYYLGNIRVAVGAPDTRNKLITEGKFVTRGILFDVNSDKIKPESYGAVKDIANVLKENSDVKVQIIGHTDSDGDEAKNLELSKKRAEAVKQFLIKEFGIDEIRITTDGKGESQPSDSNTTPEGKANNRRVEFIKI